MRKIYIYTFILLSSISCDGDTLLNKEAQVKNEYSLFSDTIPLHLVEWGKNVKSHILNLLESQQSILREKNSLNYKSNKFKSLFDSRKDDELTLYQEQIYLTIFAAAINSQSQDDFRENLLQINIDILNNDEYVDKEALLYITTFFEYGFLAISEMASSVNEKEYLQDSEYDGCIDASSNSSFDQQSCFHLVELLMNGYLIAIVEPTIIGEVAAVAITIFLGLIYLEELRDYLEENDSCFVEYENCFNPPTVYDHCVNCLRRCLSSGGIWDC